MQLAINISEETYKDIVQNYEKYSNIVSDKLLSEIASGTVIKNGFILMEEVDEMIDDIKRFQDPTKSECQFDSALRLCLKIIGKHTNKEIKE